MRIAAEFLWPYVIANTVALVMLVLAFWRPAAARWMGVGLFAWASVTNAVICLTEPWRYVEYATLTPFNAYREFILGWFGEHVAWVVLPIAVGQMAIAILLASRARNLRWLGVVGAIVFLLAIAPLGVGSGFPFSVTCGLALFFAVHGVGASSAAARRALRWTPRLLGIGLTVFLAMFALDAFNDGFSLRAIGGFAMHLRPAAIVLGVIALAWRWPWIGGIVFFALAVTYAVWTRGYLSWMVVISGPMLIEGILFLMSWRAEATREARV